MQSRFLSGQRNSETVDGDFPEPTAAELEEAFQYIEKAAERVARKAKQEKIPLERVTNGFRFYVP